MPSSSTRKVCQSVHGFMGCLFATFDQMQVAKKVLFQSVSVLEKVEEAIAIGMRVAVLTEEVLVLSMLFHPMVPLVSLLRLDANQASSPLVGVSLVSHRVTGLGSLGSPFVVCTFIISIQAPTAVVAIAVVAIAEVAVATAVVAIAEVAAAVVATATAEVASAVVVAATAEVAAEMVIATTAEVAAVVIAPTAEVARPAFAVVDTVAFVAFPILALNATLPTFICALSLLAVAFFVKVIAYLQIHPTHCPLNHSSIRNLLMGAQNARGSRRGAYHGSGRTHGEVLGEIHDGVPSLFHVVVVGSP